jgi:hypothetical protein
MERNASREKDYYRERMLALIDRDCWNVVAVIAGGGLFSSSANLLGVFLVLVAGGMEYNTSEGEGACLLVRYTSKWCGALLARLNPTQTKTTGMMGGGQVQVFSICVE